jgi:hypothetical protein
MSIVTALNIGNQVSYLENSIKKLKLSSDRLTFKIIINDSLKLLSSISKLVKNRDNLFGKKIATELFINILSFLSYKYVSICRSTSMVWLKILKSNFSKKTLFTIPTNIYSLESINLNFNVTNMFKIKNYIYFTNYLGIYKFNIKTFELIRENNMLHRNVVYSNDKYICTRNFDEIGIFSLEMIPISKITAEGMGNLVIDDHDRILVTSYDKFYVYNIHGYPIKKWDIRALGSENITIDSNEIFMTDAFHCVKVFSYEGKLIRLWGEWGSEPGKFKSPTGITIYKNVVFVVDTGNSRIQGFTRYGKFIFEQKFKDKTYIENIIIVDDYIYINSIDSSKILKLKLTKSYFNY